MSTYRSMAAVDPDEAEQPRYNSCSGTIPAAVEPPQPSRTGLTGDVAKLDMLPTPSFGAANSLFRTRLYKGNIITAHHRRSSELDNI